MVYLGKKRRLLGRQIGKRKAQASLELALTSVCILTLLLGSLNVFLWANKRLVLRQEDYENDPDYGRVKAGSSDSEIGLREEIYPYEQLNIFKEGG